MATGSASALYAPTASRALSYLTERAEDAQAALKGILGGAGPGAAGPSGADRYLGAVDLAAGEQGVKLTRAKLESSLEHDRLEGLRTVIAMISKSLPASNHLFPSVLKLTSAPSLQVKTLVYLVTLRLAPSQPDVALLSINSFQRDLSDSSPMIRGMALRVLSGLGVKMAVPLMEMAIAKGVRDPSFYVRRIAADAVGKCYELANSSLPSLLPHLTTLLGDRHPSVLGSALLAFNCTLPDRLDLLHVHFRRICQALVDIDEWNQPVTLRVLAGYARTYLRRPSQQETQSIVAGKPEKVVPGRSKWGTGLDKDLELLLNRAEPLLLSRNPACVLSTAHLYLTLLPIDSPRQQDIVQPLLRLLHGHPSQAHIVLLFIARLISLRFELFKSSSLAFLPLTSISGEPSYITEKKLAILVDLAICGPNISSIKLAKTELEEAALYRSEPGVVICAVRGLGRLATSVSTSIGQSAPSQLVEDCAETLLSVLKERCGNKFGDRAVPTCVDVLRIMITTRAEQTYETEATLVDAATMAHILNRLASLLFKASEKRHVAPQEESATSASSVNLVGKSSIMDGNARASIYWLLGQYCRQEIVVLRRESITMGGEGESKTFAEVILPDILRKGCLHFGKESDAAKLALLTLSSRLYVFLPTTSAPSSVVKSVAQLHSYVLKLGRYDSSYDVRDRARYYRNLTAGVDAALMGTEFNGGAPVKSALGIDEDSEGGALAPAGGVRLRREQLLLILFGNKVSWPDLQSASKAVSSSPGALRSKASADPARYLDPLRFTSSIEAYQKGEGEEPDDAWDYEGSLPPWNPDQSQLPPATVREPVALPYNVNTATSLSSSNSNDRSRDDSGSAPSISPAVTTISRGPSSAKVVLTPTSSAAAAGSSRGTSSGTSSPLPPLAGSGVGVQEGKGKYKDLDDFLNEEEEEEEDSSSSEEEDSSEVEEDEVETSNGENSESSEDDEEEDSEEETDMRQAISRPLLPAQNEWAM